MADEERGNSPDKPLHVHHAVQTYKSNLYKEDMVTLGASGDFCFTDHKARSVWTVALVILGNAAGASVTGVLEFTLDGTNYMPMGAAITANAGTPIVVQNITGFAAWRVRFRTYGTFTLGSATAYRAQIAAAGS